MVSAAEARKEDENIQLSGYWPLPEVLLETEASPRSDWHEGIAGTFVYLFRPHASDVIASRRATRCENPQRKSS